MPIDRRITNGLAWAGAVIVIAIPAADIALRQFGPQPEPQIAVVEAQPETPSLPTSASERPTPVAVETPAASESAAEVRQPVSQPANVPDPVNTATSGTAQSGASGSVVDDFVSSGRPLPSYISNGGGAASAPTVDAPAPARSTAAAPAVASPAPAASAPSATPPAVTPPASPQPAATTTPEQVANVPRSRIVTFPTPVSERPPSVPRSQVATQQPLIVEPQPPLIVAPEAPIVTGADLDDWESGPLSEFLARRQGGGAAATPDYDPDGFFLDEGPNSRNQPQRFPRAYEDEYYYPFQ